MDAKFASPPAERGQSLSECPFPAAHHGQHGAGLIQHHQNTWERFCALFDGQGVVFTQLLRMAWHGLEQPGAVITFTQGFLDQIQCFCRGGRDRRQQIGVTLPHGEGGLIHIRQHQLHLLVNSLMNQGSQKDRLARPGLTQHRQMANQLPVQNDRAEGEGQSQGNLAARHIGRQFHLTRQFGQRREQDDIAQAGGVG